MLIGRPIREVRVVPKEEPIPQPIPLPEEERRPGYGEKGRNPAVEPERVPEKVPVS